MREHSVIFGGECFIEGRIIINILLFASMLYDLVISRGEEEIEKPDLTVVFYTDIAASCVPVYANQTWSFLHMILSTGSQSLVNFVPVSPIVFYLHVYPFYVY